MAADITLSGPHGRLCLKSAGGMIGPFRAALGSGRMVDVLTTPEWRNAPGAEDWLPLIRNLSGDFICLPYGAPEPNPDLPEAWLKGVQTGPVIDPMFHGTPPNAKWTVTPGTDGTAATLSIGLPEPHPLKHIERRVNLLDDAAGYAVTLAVTARTDCRLPLSLHPCFRLPDTVGALELSVPQSGPGWTYPVAPVPEHQGVEPNTTFESVARVSTPGSGSVDLTRLPPEGRCEVLLQLPVAKGEAHLAYTRDGHRVLFEWDKAVLPSLVLWISNHGRDEAPFSGTFRTLGVEAIAGAFDLGPHVSASPENPIACSGLATAIAFEAGKTFETAYQITVGDL